MATPAERTGRPLAPRRERLLAALAVVAVSTFAVVALTLLRTAENRGVDALEQSLSNEIDAVSQSLDQRIESSLTGSSGLARQPWTLEVGSAEDVAILESLLAFVPDAEAGFFVVDDDGILTAGVLLRDDVVGEPYDRPGFEEAVADPAFAAGRGALLPVADGLTTPLPTLAFAFPILDPATSELRGSFLLETTVTPENDFNAEIAQLRRGDTGSFLFLDDRGGVVAANDPALVGRQIDDLGLLALDPGLHDAGGEIVAVADVPSAGWRTVFRQARSEFEEDLTGPLQTIGRLVVAGLTLVGGLLFVLLLRRLRAAREEERRLRELAASQEEFISIVSHELRTPVAGVLGFLQSTADHWDQLDDDERRHAVERATRNARRLQSLARDVLDTESLESGRLHYAFDDVDLAEELRVAADAVDDPGGVRVAVEVPAGPVAVRADPDRLQQVLTNLLDNAVRNSPPDRAVTLSLAPDGDMATVTVRDEGAGLDAGTRERVFDKFVRAQAGVSGTGLGLYIARQIVEAHGGRIWADSAPGEGASFRFTVPLRDDTAEPATPTA